MKRLFLLSTVILLSALCANAIDWKPLEVTTPNIDVYYDSDALRTVNNYEYYYTIRYKALGQSEKIAYIKANTQTKKIGIIQAGEYDPDTYRPNAVLETVHVFMKPVKEDSFLYYANDKVAKIISGVYLADNTKNDAFIPVSYRSNLDAKSYMTNAEYTSYMDKTCELLKNNWNKPSVKKEKKTIIKVAIGTDGSLQDYKVVKSSGNDTIDRSVISAVEKTVLFPRYTIKNTDVNALNFQFIFINKMFKKSVIY